MRSAWLSALAFILIAAKQNEPAPLGTAIDLGAKDIVAAPSAAVRSGALSLATERPSQPVRFDFVCMASGEGAIFDCVRDASKLGKAATWLDFVRVAGVDEKAAVDHSLEGLARLRVRRTVLRARGERRETYLVRLSESVSPNDLVQLGPPTRQVKREDLQFARFPDQTSMARLYPQAALRDAAEARVTVRCRIQSDTSLFCYGGDAGERLRPGDAEDFVFATYQLFSLAKVQRKTKSGLDAVGAEVELSATWAL